MKHGEIEVGQHLPVFERTIDLPDMVAYGAATWDWHRMHYDRAWAENAGLPAPVVDGQMFGALLAKQLLDWLGPRAFVTDLKMRYKAMVFAGETVRCEGAVTAHIDGVVEVEQKVRVGDRIAVEGTARARLAEEGA